MTNKGAAASTVTTTKKVGDDMSDIIVSEPPVRRGKRHSEEDYKAPKRPALSDMTNKPQDRPNTRQTRAQKKKEMECAPKQVLALVPLQMEEDGEEYEMDSQSEWEHLPHADIDFGDDKDPQLCSIYVQDIYTYLRENQVRYQPADYMTYQKDITVAMRAILVDWLVEVAEEYNLSSETLYLAVSYVDRDLSKKPVNRSKLQLVGVASILIAAKYEEIYAPSVDDMVFIADNTYTKEEVFAMESSVLDVLGFCLSGATIRSFLKRSLKAAGVGSDAKASMFASYLCELSLQNYDCLKYLPSVIAAAATALTLFTLNPGEPCWSSTLEYYTHHRVSDPEIMECMRDLHTLQRQAPNSSLQAVRDKYEQLCKVSDPHVIPPVLALPF